MIENGTTSIEELTPVEWANAVEVFLCKAIELHVFNEIGLDAVGCASDVAKLDQIENDLIVLIRGEVQNKILPLIENRQARSVTELNQHMTFIADRAFDYLDALADHEE